MQYNPLARREAECIKKLLENLVFQKIGMTLSVLYKRRICREKTAIDKMRNKCVMLFVA